MPVKVLARAKTRMGMLAEAAEPHRERFALAIASDTVTAALACDAVRQVVVVTDDPLARERLAELGARVIADVPGSGLNPALRHGAAAVAEQGPADPVAAISADLPALRAGELSRVLAEAGRFRQAFVPDAAGEGTTLYAAASPAAFAPRFGAGSRRRHRDAGARELALPDIASVRHDVDTPDDLRAAVALGVGRHTEAILAALLGHG